MSKFVVKFKSQGYDGIATVDAVDRGDAAKQVRDRYIFPLNITSIREEGREKESMGFVNNE